MSQTRTDTNLDTNSAIDTNAQPESYKLEIFCTRHERENIEASLDEQLFPFAVASFENTPDGEEWRVEAWFHDCPDNGACADLFGPIGWELSPVMPENWVAKSLRPLDPIKAGRFFVYGSHDDPHDAPTGAIPLMIDAGMAFGTGHHETTFGCLQAVSTLSKSLNPRSILDLGCGTGLLGIAAAKIWRDVPITFSDIDPDATDFTRKAVKDNGLGGRPDLSIITANGLIHPGLAQRAPYDLIIANILAAPLVRLAPSICNALSKSTHARIVLSGLLVKQEQMVMTAYRTHGLSIHSRIRVGEWSALILSRTQIGR